jgi:hypothetical protein
VLQTIMARDRFFAQNVVIRASFKVSDKLDATAGIELTPLFNENHAGN